MSRSISTLRNAPHPRGFSIALQKAVGKGEIRLATADPHNQPILDYRYLSEPFDTERLRGAVRLAAEISEMPEYAPAKMRRLDPTDDVLADDEALDNWLRQNVRTQHHLLRGLQDGAVVRPDGGGLAECEMYAVDGLMVVDASVMPDVIRANTNATTIMIAEKVAGEMG